MSHRAVPGERARLGRSVVRPAQLSRHFGKARCPRSVAFAHFPAHSLTHLLRFETNRALALIFYLPPTIFALVSDTMLRICQSVASINRNTGGPAVSVSKLAEYLAAHQIDSHLFTLDYACHGPHQPLTRATLHSVPAIAIARRFRGFSFRAQRTLSRLASNFSLIHNHGLWMFPNRYARIAAVRAKIPLIISPRGMLSGWALGRSRLKKHLVWWLFERANLAAAHAFHATSQDEMTEIRRTGFRQPIAVIPNGVDLPDLDQIPARETIEAKYPQLRGHLWLLFLSRLHPKKGLRELLNAWAALGGKRAGWKLIIAGPDLDDHRPELEALVQQHQLQNDVLFTGMIEGAGRECVLGRSDLFVLPTRSENFGLVIAESLAAGVPVITTRGAPWEELASTRSGWWIDQCDLRSTLEEAMALPSEVRREMGRRGRELVGSKYSWERVAGQMAEFYRWILINGARPKFVRES